MVDTVRVDARTVNDVKVSEDGRVAVISREGASNRRNGIVLLDVSDPTAGVRVISSYDDEQLMHVFYDLAGHDIEVLIEALEESKKDAQTPCMIVVHTLKGNRLKSVAATGNHSSIPDEDETAFCDW